MPFCNTSTLFHDLRLMTEMPDLCDVKFIVGKDKVPIYGVKSVMATRSRFLYQSILAKEKELTGSTKQTKLKLVLLPKLKQFRKKKFLSSEKRQASPGLLTIHLPGENPAIFRDIIQFVHSGRISASVHNIVDVMVTADNYGLTELCSSCFHFATSFINLDTILPLLTSTLRFLKNKWIKRLLIKIWDFVDENAGLIFQTSGFEKIPKESAMLILSRPKLSVTEAEIRKTVSDRSRRQCHVTDKETFDSLESS
ncbi:serine-enriched protein-like [Liolophura sinensis]|uniref:serine-enriched protein-like n=1 Tax=Liolophura sinensis TaxID=3198878 RepID=UPI0031583E8E